MLNFMTQPGLTTAVLDFTKDLSPLGTGLFGLLVLSAGLIACAAIRHHLHEKTTPAIDTAPAATDHREAA